MKGFVVAAFSGLMLSAVLVPAVAGESVSVFGEFSAEELDGTRAKGTPDVEINQNGTVSNDNGQIHGDTGTNSFGGISGTGLMNVSQNTGNNVSIQQAIGVNVTLGN